MADYSVPWGGPSQAFVPNSSIAQLILQAGQQRAAGQERMGQIISQGIGQLGQIPQQMAEQKIAQQRADALTAEQNAQAADRIARTAAAKRQEDLAALTGHALRGATAPDFDINKAIEGLPDEAVQPIMEQYGKIQTSAATLNDLKTKAAKQSDYHIAMLADNAKAVLGTPLQDRLLPGLLAEAAKSHPEIAAQAQGLSPEDTGAFLDTLMEKSPDYLQEKATREKTQAEAEKAGKPKTPEVGSFGDYLTATPERQKQIAEARKGYHEAGTTINLGGMNALYGAIDPEATADGIIRGDASPMITELGRPAGAAVESLLMKKGYNLAGAQTDWKATQKHISTLNGPQQLRLNQSINALPDLLDSVDTLASQWKGGQFPALNKANLAAAKGGLYGSEVATVARKLETQIADVTADLGTVYMGGNTPTDHALDLAKTALAGDWDEKVLKAMIKQAKANVQIRKNSILTTGVAGASAGNQYAPPAPSEPTGPAKPASKAEFDALPSGTEFIAPDGSRRRKP